MINLLPHKKTNHVKQINSGNMVIVQRQWQQCWTNRPDPADLFRSYCMVPDPASLTQHSLWLYYSKYISSSSSSCSNRIMILYIFPCFPFAHHLAFSGSHNSSSLYTLWVWECGTSTHTHTHTHTHIHTHTYLHTHTGTPDSWYCHMFHVSIKCVPTRRKEVGHSLKPHSGSATIFLWSPFFFNQ